MLLCTKVILNVNNTNQLHGENQVKLQLGPAGGAVDAAFVAGLMLRKFAKDRSLD